MQELHELHWGQLNFESINVIYLVICSKCLQQYVGLAAKFKTRFGIPKSDIKTKKERYVSTRHFNGKCYHDTNPFQYLKVQLIKLVHSNNLDNIEDVYGTGRSTGTPSYLP